MEEEKEELGEEVGEGEKREEVEGQGGLCHLQEEEDSLNGMEQEQEQEQEE